MQPCALALRVPLLFAILVGADEDVDCSTMKTMQLRRWLAARGLSCSGCVEKYELVNMCQANKEALTLQKRSRSEWKQDLMDFYTRYGLKHKIDGIDRMLDQWKGLESKMMDKLYKKYDDAIIVVKPLDEWDAKDTADFMRREASVTITPDAVRAHGLIGADMLRATEDWLGGVPGFEEDVVRKRALRKIRELGSKVTHAPKSFSEWCVVNHALCNGWLIPLSSMAPRALMLWVRQANSSDYGQMPGGAFERVDHVIDDTTAATFWSTLVIVPSWPLLSAMSQYKLQSGFDSFVQMMVMINVLEELALAISMLAPDCPTT